jgi:tripartite ATP-independent transporter DctM subunit
MSSLEIGLMGLGVLFLLLALKVPIGLALIGVSAGGLWVLLGERATFGILQSVPGEFAANWALSAVPMFLLMGFLGYHAGLTTALFDFAKLLLGRLPGGLAVASVFGCTGFAAVCGSSVACAAAMGKIAIPEMVRAGYNRNFACGTVAAGGTIGALVPPSILLILFGVFAQVSIVKLFLGGIGVGLLTAMVYVIGIVGLSLLRPGMLPTTGSRSSPGEIWRAARGTAPVVLLLVCVFGGLFGGVITATEAGAVGAAFVFVIAAFQRRLSLGALRRSVVETVATCGVLLIIGVGATMFTRFLSLSGAGDLISSHVVGLELGYWQLMFAFVVVYLILGTFMDGIGAMLITLPIFIPVMKLAGIELIWFGVMVTKLIEIGMMTPPFGMNVLVIKGVVGNLTSLMGIFRGVLLFVILDLVVVAACMAWPDLVLYIPRNF